MGRFSRSKSVAVGPCCGEAAAAVRKSPQNLTENTAVGGRTTAVFHAATSVAALERTRSA